MLIRLMYLLKSVVLVSFLSACTLPTITFAPAMGDQYQCSISEKEEFERFISAVGELKTSLMAAGLLSTSPGESNEDPTN